METEQQNEQKNGRCDGIELLPHKNHNQLQRELLSQDLTTNLYFLLCYPYPMNLKDNQQK